MLIGFIITNDEMPEVKFESNRERDEFIESMLNSVDNKISNEEMYVLKKYILGGDNE